LIWENKNAFFEIAALTQNSERDVISLDIEEEASKTDVVSITFRDPLLAYDDMLVFGRKVSVDWGLRGAPPVQRKNTGFVTNSTNTGDGKGGVTTQISIQSIRDFQTVVKIHTGTRESVVLDAILSMGAAASVVNFPLMKKSVEQMPQMENNFAFLVKLSREWNCHFRMACNTRGALTAAFCGADKLHEFVEAIGGKGAVKLNYGAVDYKKFDVTHTPNVMSYTKNRTPAGNAGQGAVITIGADNNPVLTRVVVESESVKTYKLNTAKCAAAIKKFVDSGGDAMKFWELWLAPSVGWETAKEYYDLGDANTASESMGYTVSCKLIGNPFVSAGSMMYFGSGFSDDLGAANRTWWARKVKHSFSSQGYSTDVEVVDSMQMSDAGMQIPMVMDYILNEANAL
jgi:hypothetical protein